MFIGEWKNRLSYTLRKYPDDKYEILYLLTGLELYKLDLIDNYSFDRQDKIHDKVLDAISRNTYGYEENSS